MKNILGLDLGTNSIGWALISIDNENSTGQITTAGSRIIPMSQEIIGEFDKGNSVSQTADRRGFRGTRRLRERSLLRRERLHRILNLMNYLPGHYSQNIDFEKHFGQFYNDKEPKLAYNDAGDFIFKKSFNQMLENFSQHQTNQVNNGNKIPYDWTIYYLRKKALTQKIEKEELAWILLNFNQKRGYYQLRGEDAEENPDKLEEFYELKVLKVEEDEKNKKGEVWYNIHLENGWIYRRSSKTSLNEWTGKIKEFIVTTQLTNDGNIKLDKDGKECRSFKAVNSEEDWIAIKKSTERKLEVSNQTVGSFIYDNLLKNPNQKIRGKLIRTIERKYYKAELLQILEKQKEFHLELQDKNLYIKCISELYRNNLSHKENISNKNFTYLFTEDIIFYQRPLKSKKSLISNCRFESRKYKKPDGNIGIAPIKCIAKSHPIYQEFRLWKWINNLKIYTVDSDKEVTAELIKNEADIVSLFEWLKKRKEVENKQLIGFLINKDNLSTKEYRTKTGLDFKEEIEKYRWNYVTDKKYPCNETSYQIRSRLIKVQSVPSDFLNNETETALWHILYSVEDNMEIKKALKTFATRHELSDDFIDIFCKYPRIEKEYGAYSEKAIRKLLSLMRTGPYWKKEGIDVNTLKRIDKITTGEIDDSISERTREKTKHINKIEDCRGLNETIASYFIYDRHSEDSENKKWHFPNEIEQLKQHELRNPIVEQVINETLKVVKDIWTSYGEGKEGFFNEIHIELGREIKSPASQREKITRKNIENENTNLRIKSLLAELINDNNIENVRPYSPSQQEILKIYEEGAISSSKEIPDDILKISKLAQPSKTELNKYKLWLEQKYRSPYTGAIIPLSKLFTYAYEIEHIIPQSRYFDDSLSNKVICEAEVNTLKSNQLGLEFIRQHHGEKVSLSLGKTVEVFSEEHYIDFVKTNYSGNIAKMKKLLMDDIPEKMIERQLNDSRYISKKVKNLLSNIVRGDENDDGTTSKNVLSSNGTITTILKRDWGLNDVWNELIAPRFVRLNEMTNSDNFGKINPNTKKFLPQVPLELQKSFSPKRIDHRHHAMDAIVIACASRNHINYLNNEYAHKDTKEIRYELRNKLRRLETIEFYDKATGTSKKVQIAKEFYKPWPTFTEDSKKCLENIIVSFKQNLRIINNAANKYQKWVTQPDGSKKKEFVMQLNGDNRAVRKSMHKDTVFGLVNLRFIKTVSLSAAVENHSVIVDSQLKKKIIKLKKANLDSKAIIKKLKDEKYQLNGGIDRVKIYEYKNDLVASRESLGTSFTRDKIEKITDTGIQKILTNHLNNYIDKIDGKVTEHPEFAFSPEGIDELNKNITILNNGKPHKAIYKVRVYEPLGNKFRIGVTGNKKDKYVEAAKGTNLYFAIYVDENGKRNYDSVPLNIVIERLKQGLTPVPETNEKLEKLLFYLSPNDLVYLPDENEDINKNRLNALKNERIYKVVSFTGTQLFLVRNNIATPIFNKFEFSPLNKTEKSIDGIMIKEVCLKLKLDRIGNITNISKF